MFLLHINARLAIKAKCFRSTHWIDISGIESNEHNLPRTKWWVHIITRKWSCGGGGWVNVFTSMCQSFCPQGRLLSHNAMGQADLRRQIHVLRRQTPLPQKAVPLPQRADPIPQRADPFLRRQIPLLRRQIPYSEGRPSRSPLYRQIPIYRQPPLQEALPRQTQDTVNKKGVRILLECILV